jgi:hypothetical protein
MVFVAVLPLWSVHREKGKRWAGAQQNPVNRFLWRRMVIIYFNQDIKDPNRDQTAGKVCLLWAAPSRTQNSPA